MKRIALILVYRDELLLLGKRNDGRWTIPAGSIEEGEASEDGALRELKEEADLEPDDDLELIEVREIEGKTLYLYECRVEEGVPDSSNDPDEEVEYWGWFDVSDGIPKAIGNKLNGPKGKDNIVIDYFGLAKSQAAGEGAPLTPLTKLVLLNNLAKMAMEDLGEGYKPSRKSPYYNYEHVLPPKLRKQGYTIRVEHWGSSKAGANLQASVHKKDPRTKEYKLVGALEGTAQPDNRLYVGDAMIHSPLHRGRGLGKAMYEAIYAHAYHKHGAREAYGHSHSTSAHAVHEALKTKHGWDYQAQPDPAEASKPTGDYDAKFGGYNYALKSEGAARVEESLNKGSWQRKFPFDPNKESLRPVYSTPPEPKKSRKLKPPEVIGTVGKLHDIWGSGGNSAADPSLPDYWTVREKLAEAGMSPEAKSRSLRKLFAKTLVRRNPSGGLEFLLHRGVGKNEINFSHGTHYQSKNHTSWTSDPNIAHQFADDYGHVTGHGKVVSAWIPAHAIKFDMNHLGSTDKSPLLEKPTRQENLYSDEREYLVAPGKFEQYKPEAAGEGINKAEIDEIDRQLAHPNPHERSMGLKMNGVRQHHLVRAFEDVSPEIRSSALNHPSLDRDSLMGLMQLPGQHDLKLAALNNPRINANHLSALYNHSKDLPPNQSTTILRAIANHNELSPELIGEFAQNGHGHHVVQNLNTPGHILDSFVDSHLNDPTNVKKKVLARHSVVHPNTSPEMIEKAFKSGAPDVKLAIATMGTPPEALAKDILTRGQLPQNGHEALFRAALVTNPKVPDHIAQIATQDPNQIVQRAAKERLNTRFAKSLQYLEFEALAKATNPNDYKSVVKALTPEGASLVDHKPDLTAHPAEHQPDVDAYRHGILNSDNLVKRKGAKMDTGANISAKAIYVTPEDHPTHGGVKFMVKPYHERVTKRLKYYQKHPHQGWSEMTSQALYHAGGIGNLHQKVHVAEHNMGPGHEKEPALVIQMAPGAEEEVYRNRAPEQKVKHTSGLRKIALLDFLSNNLDRHAGNIMTVGSPGFGPLLNREGQPTGGYGQLPGDTPLVVDNSRSFQYINNHGSKWKARRNQPKNLEDNFPDYIYKSALGHSEVAKNNHTGEDVQKNWGPTFDWWAEHSPQIRQTMDKRLEQIKDPEIRAHIKRNFDARANYLDDIAHHGPGNFGHLNEWPAIPQYRPDEKTEEELRQDKFNQENPELAEHYKKL